jgi:mercuric ion binding protein
MKKLKSFIIYALLFPMGIIAAAGANDTISFRVSGNCEMCKETIEDALDVKGVKSSDWNMETHVITVIFDADKINEEKIHELIAAAGYDTDKKKADEAAYKKLPKCCKYKVVPEK